MNKKGNVFGIVLLFIIATFIIGFVFWTLSDSARKSDEQAKNPKAQLDREVANSLSICGGQTFCEIYWGTINGRVYFTKTDFINAMDQAGYEFQSAGGRYSDYLYFKKKQ